jgi:hypothetical protein
LYSYTNATVQMLAKLGLTEDRFNAMGPADQQKIEEKVREMIKQQVQNTSDKRGGMITDKSTRGVSQEQSERRLLGQSHICPGKPRRLLPKRSSMSQKFDRRQQTCRLAHAVPRSPTIKPFPSAPPDRADRVFAKSPRRLIGTRSQSKEKHL